MSVSQLAKTINESPTLRLNEEARLLREKGESVINLGIGEPKNSTPLSAILSSTAKLSTGNVKYTPTDGLPSLKKAILGYMEKHYNKLVSPKNILVSTGAKQCIYNSLFSIVNPDDEVILLAPHWVSYPEMVKMVYGIPIIVMPEEGTFLPRIEDIQKAVNSNTKAIIINSPNNPSGVIYPESFIADIVDFCERKGIYLIMDDIYHQLVFDGVRAAPGYDFTDKDIDESYLIVVNGVSKAYGMTGFRIGWVVASNELIQAMINIQGQITSNASSISQAAAEGALAGDQSVIEDLRLTIQNNRDVMLQALHTFNGVEVTMPSGTFYCLPDFRAYNTDSRALADFLLEKALVVTVPGVAFGMEGHLRLSYAGSMKDIIEGVERIKWALDPDSPKEMYIGDRKMVRDWL
jgi:aspartate aminotransferase